jgi:23S rRNA (pseudouridine1915-N3)-methyltransferase
MNIEIISIGKFRNSPQKEIFELYKKRCSWNIKLKELEVKSGSNPETIKEKEGDLILSSVPSSAKIILLDETGKNLSSKEFAGLIQNFRNNSVSNLAFIIGGADGTSIKVKQKADIILSLGKLTFPHMMVRSILSEQLYRAFSIINNHPYHRE